MKGKTLAIGVLVITIVAVAAIYFLVMATFKHDEPNGDTSSGVPITLELTEQSILSL